MWKTITKPFEWLMIRFYNLTGGYGWAVILFALTVNLILTPFMAKSKKSMMRSTRLQPRIQELQRRQEHAYPPLVSAHPRVRPHER